jgi:hypothetical protein
MKRRNRTFYRLAILAFSFAIGIGLTIVMSGQQMPRASVVEDWSTHHLVFSNPGSPVEAMSRGSLDRWIRVVNDPRYVMQQLRRSATVQPPVIHRPPPQPPPPPPHRLHPMQRDWSMNMAIVGSQTGTVSGAVSTAAGQTITITNTADASSITLTATPTVASATGTFSGEPTAGQLLTITNGASSIQLSDATSGTGGCTSGASPRTGSFTRSTTTNTNATNLRSLINSGNCGAFVGVTATGTSPAVIISATTAGSAGNNITLTHNFSNFSPAWSSTALTGGTDLTDSGTFFSTNATASTEATHIATAITNNGGTVGVSASSGGTATVTVTGAASDGITLADTVGNFSWTGTTLVSATATVGADQYPAKFSFSTTSASCDSAPTTPDFAVFTTGLAGSSTQPSIIAYDNLYTGCTGSHPLIYWQYNTNGGTIVTSPVLFWDGSQVAFMHTGAPASLVILKWAKSDTLTTLTNTAASSYHACTAPCMTAIPFASGTANDTNSSPFYDYIHDVIYVGDDSGVLHKFQNIFRSGTPAEITGGGTGSGWPQTISSGNVLTGPVYDPVSTDVFVGSSAGTLSRILSTGGSSNLVTSGRVAFGTHGLSDSPHLDSTPATPKVYVFVGCDTSTSCSNNNGTFQFATSFAAANTGIEEVMGSAAAGLEVYVGAFDNTHYNGDGTTGNLYVCGAHSSGTIPRLYGIAMNGAFTGGVTASASGEDPASAAAVCSPITEFLDISASTTLSAGINNSTTSIPVTSGTGFANGDYIQIDSEILHITAGGGTATLTATRAQLGTTAVAHSSGATVSDIHDWMYLSVTAGGQETGCTGACLYNYNINTALIATSTATAGLAAAGGTSGIIIDNMVVSGTLAGASQIYYSTLAGQACAGNGSTGSGTGGCAVQASQSAP